MRLFCIHCEAKEVSAGPDYLNVNYQNIGQVHIRVHLEKKKRSYFFKFRSSTQLFLCRRISWSISALPGWWTGLYLSCLSPAHLLSISRSSESILASVHLETTTSWMMPYFYDQHCTLLCVALSSPVRLQFPTPIQPCQPHGRLETSGGCHHHLFDVPRMFGLMYIDVI